MMTNLTLQHLRSTAGSALFPLALFAACTCSYPILAQPLAQPAFSSAAQATEALFQTVQSNDGQAIANILGGPTGLASSRDDAQDMLDRELFVRKYEEMHRLRREPDGSMILYIGSENWPFPIPVIQKDGAWRFDPDTGMKEVMMRRIGENEFSAIASCRELVVARNRNRGKAEAGSLANGAPASSLVRAGINSTEGPAPSHGYIFREVSLQSGTRQGTAGKAAGFAIIAYPAEYRSSGVMTFVATANGVVYEKDLGEETAKLATEMTAFHKDATWHVADK